MGAKILVVDDSPTVSSTVEWLLSNRGYRVRVAPDGLSALGAISAFDPDLVLLDIKLPHMDGIQLCEMLRRDVRYASLPIVMLSGISAEADIRRALESGADGYVVKPFNDLELTRIIEERLAEASSASNNGRT
jgi:DNA-binding response OmpR family regulator